MSGPYASPAFQYGGVPVSFYLSDEDNPTPIRYAWSDNQGMTVQVDFLIRWTDLIKFLQALAGSSSYAAPAYSRKLPIALAQIIGDKSPGLDGQPEDYQWYRFVCMGTGEIAPVKWRTDVDGSITGTAGWGNYEMAIVPTTWGVPTYIVADKELLPDYPGADISGFPFTTTSIKAAGESYSPYSTGYKFNKSGTQIDDAKVGLIRPKLEITIVRHQMPFVDAKTYEDLIGALNNGPMKFGNTEYPEDSILYMGYEPESRPDVATGGLTYDITHHLVANGPVEDVDGNQNSSWNYFVTPEGKWDLVVQTQGGKPAYSTENFRMAIWPEYV